MARVLKNLFFASALLIAAAIGNDAQAVSTVLNVKNNAASNDHFFVFTHGVLGELSPYFYLDANDPQSNVTLEINTDGPNPSLRLKGQAVGRAASGNVQYTNNTGFNLVNGLYTFDLLITADIVSLEGGNRIRVLSNARTDINLASLINPQNQLVSLPLVVGPGFSFEVYRIAGTNWAGSGWAYGENKPVGGDFHFTGKEVPEPATLALLGAGLALGGFRRRRALQA